MRVNHIILAVLMVASVPCATMADQIHPTERKLGTGKVKPAKPKASVTSTDEAERAARIAEGRRKFFESRPDDDDTVTPTTRPRHFLTYPAGDSGPSVVMASVKRAAVNQYTGIWSPTASDGG